MNDFEAMERLGSDEDSVEALQALIDSGTAWKLEGSVGRAAMDAIEAGVCVLAEKGYHDYWGNYVPSRYEVQAGTKGSTLYAAQMKEQEWL